MVFVVNALYLLKKIRMCSDLYPAKCFTGEKEIIERIPRSSNCAPRFVHFFLFMVMGEGDDAGGKVVAKAERKGELGGIPLSLSLSPLLSPQEPIEA
jgi:hypothetical protein